ncbi:MAG: response regulator [Candidatus Dormibacteraeota bacterium]|nr:response regulator [Candidatus Dormibacteraeota bacterium]MBV9524724.1 response regulator [Candidatus Dormibacteraeota bacterium]
MPILGEPRPRVLVAEDDDSLRRLLELRLDSHGFDVRSAADGVLALEVMDDWTPDVAVLDVMMPRLSGLSVCRELRARDVTSAVPVLLLTARHFDEDIQDVMSLGGVEYMAKPFDFSQLEETLTLLCGRLSNAGPRTVSLSEGTLR